MFSTVGFNEMKRTPVEFGYPAFGRIGGGTVTSANWGHSVLGRLVRTPGVSIASAKVIEARLLQNTPRVPEGLNFT
jgi:hypothetical protein